MYFELYLAPGKLSHNSFKLVKHLLIIINSQLSMCGLFTKC